MKKMFVILGLVVITLFVVACVPGETLAGNAKRLPKGVTAPTMGGANQILGEICDNKLDDNKDGVIDCADPKCSGWVFRGSYMEPKDNKALDSICAKGKRFTCTVDIPVYGVLNVDNNFDVFCDWNKIDKAGKEITIGSFKECDSDFVKEMNYNDDVIYLSNVNDGGLGGSLTTASCQNKVIGGKTYESWVTCGNKIGPDGLSAQIGDKYKGKYGSERICAKHPTSFNTLSWIDIK
ncbi:hypothetical protein HYT55_02085 [Candidatus Woesearchaeota archaeon]|nr:hypothetical protein [Candidatus Woesearchaeota archaeon]